MNTFLSYGRNGLEIQVPQHAEVIQPNFTPHLTDEEKAIEGALRNPIQSPALSELAGAGKSVVIAHSDITRATPNDRLLPVILSELEKAGVRKKDITLLNALGTHRRQTDAELTAMLGEDIVKNYRCVQHNAFDDDCLVPLGTTSYGHSVRVNRVLLEADLKIFTGFIEPHFFAGFSGGPKCVLPGLAGSESVLSNHGYSMISHPRAAWGITDGNPIWEEMMETALKVQPSFLVNVTLNREHSITGVFAGDLRAAHSAGCNFARLQSMVKVDHAFDIIVTSNSGYPLDQNLYQTVKGMSAARQIVRPGGAILIASACEDGLPEFGSYASLLKQAGSPENILKMVSAPGFSSPDQWQVQIQAMVQQHADVYVYSDGLSDEQIESALLLPCRDIEGTLDELMKKHGQRICVIPDGPLTAAYL